MLPNQWNLNDQRVREHTLLWFCSCFFIASYWGGRSYLFKLPWFNGFHTLWCGAKLCLQQDCLSLTVSSIYKPTFDIDAIANTNTTTLLPDHNLALVSIFNHSLPQVDTVVKFSYANNLSLQNYMLMICSICFTLSAAANKPSGIAEEWWWEIFHSPFLYIYK